MKTRSTLVAMILLSALCGQPAAAFAPDGCDAQRTQYPDNWNDTSKEKALFKCSSRQGPWLDVKLGAGDGSGHTLMSLVPLDRSQNGEGIEQKDGVFRIWLDKEQTRRLHDGKYFSTIVRPEGSCWIRGDVDGSKIFVMDNANPPPDDPKLAGEFYNKAPRLSAFDNQVYTCERLK